MKRNGDSKTPLYKRWQGIKARLKSTEEHKLKSYSGIGICEEWLIFENFKQWALTNGFRRELQIDRIDLSKGYEPSNCRWVDRATQVRNTRQVMSTNKTG